MQINIRNILILYFLLGLFANLGISIFITDKVVITTIDFLLLIYFSILNVVVFCTVAPIHTTALSTIAMPKVLITFFTLSINMISIIFFINGLEISYLSEYRTVNQRDLNIFFWFFILFFATLCLIKQTSNLIFLLPVLNIIFISSRAFLLLFLLLFAIRFYMSRKISDLLIIFLFVVSFFVIAPIRDIPISDLSKLGLQDLRAGAIFFAFELFSRNVALTQGLLVQNECLLNWSYGPLVTIIPRSIWVDKPLLDNVVLFNCYFGKTGIPDKSSGFFLASWRGLEAIYLIIHLSTYSILVFLFSWICKCYNLKYTGLLSLFLFLNPVGAIGGPFSAGIQSQIIYVAVTLIVNAVASILRSR